MRPIMMARFAVLMTLAPAGMLCAEESSTWTRTEDVIYARKDGTALTLDVFTPKSAPNGAAVIVAVSGGWYSGHEAINGMFKPLFVEPLVARGFTVFPVVHRSNPRYSIVEAVEDMNRAVRFIRHNAEKYHIDPNRLGITGGSAGGHLSLMIGLAGKPGNEKAADPVDRASSRVQAVACFYPPTDFLNWGKPGYNAIQAIQKELKDFKAPFDFTRFDPASRRVVMITEDDRRLEICKEVSPITHVSADDPPILIIHGDADTLVPIQQAHLLMDKLKAAGVTSELITKPGAGHGGQAFIPEIKSVADWFDRYIGKPAKVTTSAAAEAQP